MSAARGLASAAGALWLVAAVSLHGHAQTASDEAPYATVTPKESQVSPEKTGTDPRAATEYFVAGRELLKQRDYEHACSAFEQSRQLGTTVAVLLNLGLCYRDWGRLATAYAYYRRAEVLATLNGDSRGDFAHEEAASISQRRATLSLRLSEPASTPIEVQIDGAVQPPTTWSQPMFIDAGDHSVTIHASERQVWQGSVHVQDASQHVLIVPELRLSTSRELPASLPPSATSAARAKPGAPVTASSARDGELGAGHISALVIGGAGVVALGAGLVSGWLARSAFDESNAGHCAADTEACATSRGVVLRERAGAHATRATVLTLLGAAAIGSGVGLWFLAPSPQRDMRQPVLAVAVRSDGVQARWIGRY